VVILTIGTLPADNDPVVAFEYDTVPAVDDVTA